MAITIYESFGSRNLKVDDSTVEIPLKFVVTGTYDEPTVFDAVMLETSPTLFGLVRKSFEGNHQGGGLWLPVLTYTRGDPSEALQPTTAAGIPGGGSDEPGTAPGQDDPLGGFSFTTGNGTARILLSKETVEQISNTGAPVDPPDNRRAIGLTADGIEGVDVPTSSPEFSVTRKRRTVTLAYFDTLCELTGTTNDAEFWGMERGELLYLGAQGSAESPAAGVTITHTFRRSKNIPAGDARLTIVPARAPLPAIALSEKKGFEYVWATYPKQIIGAKALPRPDAVYRERVHDEGDFSRLQLG